MLVLSSSTVLLVCKGLIIVARKICCIKCRGLIDVVVNVRMYCIVVRADVDSGVGVALVSAVTFVAAATIAAVHCSIAIHM